MPELSGTSDLRGYLRVLWRWKLVFLLFVVAAPAAAYLIERSQPPEYQASALVGVNQTTVNTSLLNGGGGFSTSNPTAIAQLVTTSPVASVAADLMHPPANAAQIAGEVTASGNTTTNFVTITATDRNPKRAGAIANAFAHAISHSLAQTTTGEVNTAIKGVRAQLSHLRPRDPSRVTLTQQLNQLRAAAATTGSNAAILQPAGVGTPAGLNTRRAVEIGLVIGLLLAIGAVVLAESADRRLRTPGDLEAMTELTLLATVAPSVFSADLDTGPEDEESFHMLRTSLTVFNLEKQLQSVLVTSAREKEGKTTIAVRLALATAGGGLNVILIDADLRRAQVGPRLGIERDQGLGAVLAGDCSLQEALVEYPSEEDTGGRLTVVPAGTPARNPTALISSTSMRRVLAEAESLSDLVIVDTPAALAVSDALPLMSVVSGVVLVARMNQSTRMTVNRLQRVIEAAGGFPLGVVATGVTAVFGYDHYSPKYSKYYTRSLTNGSAGRFRRRGRRVEKSSTIDETQSSG